MTYQPSLIDILTTSYSANLFSADFQNQSSKISSAINRWAKLKTSGMIDPLLNGDEIDERTRLVLLNMIYFKDAWLTPFEKENTYECEFMTPEGAKNVDMMHREDESFEYFEDDKAQYLKLPYEHSSRIEFCLPKDENADLKDLAESFYKSSIEYDYNVPGTVELPVCEFNSSFDLLASLQELGLDKALAGDSLQGFFEEDEPLEIGAAIQKAAIKINEEGSEAAAITMIAERAMGIMPEEKEPFEMLMHRPFLFKIDNGGVTTFVAAVYDPQQ